VVVLFSFFHVGSIPKSSLATSLLTSSVGDHTIPTASLPPCQWSSCLSPLFLLSCQSGHGLIWKFRSFSVESPSGNLVISSCLSVWSPMFPLHIIQCFRL
jgi:hypothetical protein